DRAGRLGELARRPGTRVVRRRQRRHGPPAAPLAPRGRDARRSMRRRSWASGMLRVMQYRPTAAELLEAIGDLLGDEVIDAVPESLRHRVRVAHNLTQI